LVGAKIATTDDDDRCRCYGAEAYVAVRLLKLLLRLLAELLWWQRAICDNRCCCW